MMLVPSLLSSHPLVKKFLPYIIAGVILVAQAYWFYEQGYKAAELDQAAAQAQADAKLDKEREESYKQIVEFKEKLAKHQAEVNKEVLDAVATPVGDCPAAPELIRLLNEISEKANEMPTD